MRQKLNQLPPPPRRSTLTAKDWLGAAVVFLAVFLSTFPVRDSVSFLLAELRLSQHSRCRNAVFDRTIMRIIIPGEWGLWLLSRKLARGIVVVLGI